MFEKSLKSPWQRAMEPDESLSPEQVAGRKSAALILVANVVVAVAVPITLKSPDIPLYQSIITLVIARGLWRRAVNWDTVAIVFALLTGVILPVVELVRGHLLAAGIETLMVWGFVGAILLLLVGKPPKARRLTAIWLFLVLTVGINAWVVIRVLSR